MRGLLLPFLFFFLFIHAEAARAQTKNGIRTVVIDAGHGGKDPGAMGKISQEKNITLKIALKLGAMIHENFPDVKIIYTRDKDFFVELHQRADIANRNKADLFISIHCNANKSHVHHGAETYVMGLHKTEANLSIAKMENASILMEPDYEANYEGFDPNSDESYITFTLFQNIYLEQSTQFASIIQENLAGRENINDRGVRQAGFMVLYKTTMPSVLVETGFLSNPEEEKFLISVKGQDYIAGSIFTAFKAFKLKMDGDKLDEKKFANLDAPLKEKNATTVPVVVKDTGRTKDPQPAKTENQEICFRIQFAIYPGKVPLSSNKFKNLEDIWMYKHQGMYKYTTGKTTNVEDALRLLEILKKKGYKDAFVVAFKGDERITIEKANTLLSRSAAR